jgi:hypothetical protein
MEPPPCFSCKTDILWVVLFLQNRGDIKSFITFLSVSRNYTFERGGSVFPVVCYCGIYVVICTVIDIKYVFGFAEYQVIFFWIALFDKSHTN